MATPSRSKRSPRLNITVTQTEIDKSMKRDSSHCMIAEAIKRHVPDASFVSVDLATVRFTDMHAGVRYIYLTPRSAQLALLRFDAGEKPEPFGFRLQGASVLLTGSARKARAALATDPRGGKTPPVRVDGKSPPLGPMHGGSVKRERGNPNEGMGNLAASRTGRRRQFGLRAIIK